MLCCSSYVTLVRHFLCAEASGAVCISARHARSDVVTTTTLATVNRIDVELRNAHIYNSSSCCRRPLN